MKKIILLLLLGTQSLFANNLSITNVTKIDNNHISFDISWDNSWSTGSLVTDYRDAVWIFAKYKNNSGQWQHLEILSTTITTTTPSSLLTIYNVSNYSNRGIMISNYQNYFGTVSGTVTLEFSGNTIGLLPDFKVFGIEMVSIPFGSFYVGDGNGSATSFHQGNDVNKPYKVSYGMISVGNGVNDLAATGLTQNIPATYPNGSDSFYMAKYEITQEQYVEFLNTLTLQQQQERTESDLYNISSANRFVMSNTSVPVDRDGIACDSNLTSGIPVHFYCDLNNNGVENENNDGQNLGCSHISTADLMAYLDWAALRPATEFEYEKACRGTAYPIIDEYANGATSYTAPGYISNGGKPNETYSNVGAANGVININLFPIRVGGLATNTTTRLQSGAGFYGNMELSGNLYEFCVGATSINYTGTPGDGVLDSNGNANSWTSFTKLKIRGAGSSYRVSTRYTISFNIDNTERYIYNIRGCR